MLRPKRCTSRNCSAPSTIVPPSAAAIRPAASLPSRGSKGMSREKASPQFVRAVPSMGTSRADTVKGCSNSSNTSGNHRQPMRASRCTQRTPPGARCRSGLTMTSTALSSTLPAAASNAQLWTTAESAANSRCPRSVKQVNQPAPKAKKPKHHATRRQRQAQVLQQRRGVEGSSRHQRASGHALARVELPQQGRERRHQRRPYQQALDQPERERGGVQARGDGARAVRTADRRCASAPSAATRSSAAGQGRWAWHAERPTN